MVLNPKNAGSCVLYSLNVNWTHRKGEVHSPQIWFVSPIRPCRKVIFMLLCEVMFGVLQIVRERVAWECRTWSSLIGC